MPGFRAGMCSPYHFYDLKSEKALPLKLFPVTCMEGNFKELSPGEAQKGIFSLMDEVKKVNGMFIPIWHNHTVSDTKEYREWKKVHEEMINRVINLTDR
jgi:hypothetical protein